MPKIAYSEAEMNKAKEAGSKEGICRRCVSSLHHLSRLSHATGVPDAIPVDI